MFNVCPGCGQYRADRTIDAAQSTATCPACGHVQPFLHQPLLILSGASGAGKSTACLELTVTLDEVVVLESDILWCEPFHAPEQQALYMTLWLRMAKNIGQSGKPVLLCGAGLGVPANLESSVEARYFRTIRYLALVCDDELLAARLRARPAWRGAGGDEFVSSQVAFNRWFKEQAEQPGSPISLLDTTERSVADTCAGVREWVSATLLT